MKMYQLKTAIAIICAVCAIVSIICIAVIGTYNTDVWIACILTISYFCLAFCAGLGAKEDYKDYKLFKKSLKEDFDRLRHLYKKHYWKLDIDMLAPAYKDKKHILIWAADTALAAQVYMVDYDTANTDRSLNEDLEVMIELAKNIINNKKYI